MAVIEAGSMGKAAGRFNLTQPAVSKVIADLEHSLGVRLVERSRQGVEPTPHGRALFERGIAIFDELRAGVQDLDFLSDPTAGELRIGSTQPIAAAIVAPIIDRLCRQFPRMTFHIVAEDTGMLYRELAQRNIELVLTRITGPVAEEYASEVLFHDPLVIVSGTSNPLTRRRNIKLGELMDGPWVFSPLDTVFGSIVAEAFRACGVAPPRPAVATTSHILRNEMVTTGRYLAVVPGFSVRLPRRHPAFRVLWELAGSRMPITIITLKNRSLSPLAQLFLTRVRALTKPLATGR